jgi:transposase
MMKSTRARYTLEFKEEAIRLVTGGERVATVARNLGLSEQRLHNKLLNPSLHDEPAQVDFHSGIELAVIGHSLSPWVIT